MFSSVESLSCVQLFLTPWTAACQASLSITNSWNFLRLMSFELLMPSNHLILCPLLLLLSIFPSIKFFSNESALCGQRIGTSASASVLPMNIQDWLIFFFFYDWLIWSPCCPEDSQESSPISQFKSINFLAFSFLYSPALTSIHDHWKNHSLD